MLSLFDTYVCSILLYCGEMWGIHKALMVEKVQLDYFKMLLGVKRCTANLKSTCDVNLLSKLSIIFKEWRVIVLFVL